MKNAKLTVLAFALMAFGPVITLAQAQVAGTQPVGISAEQADVVVSGWSVKRHLLGKPVFNDKGEKVGVLHDIVVAPNDAVSFAVVSCYQFAGVAVHDVAVPITQLDFADGRLVWAGATRSVVRAMPAFQYAKVSAIPIARGDFPHH
jgi:hypothetical protein